MLTRKRRSGLTRQARTAGVYYERPHQWSAGALRRLILIWGGGGRLPPLRSWNRFVCGGSVSVSVDHEDRRERRFRAAPHPPQRTKRPTPITPPTADFVGELCMILLTIREGGSPSGTSPLH